MGISGYLSVSVGICGNLWVCVVICGYLWLSVSICGYLCFELLNRRKTTRNRPKIAQKSCRSFPASMRDSPKGPRGAPKPPRTSREAPRVHPELPWDVQNEPKNDEKSMPRRPRTPTRTAGLKKSPFLVPFCRFRVPKSIKKRRKVHEESIKFVIMFWNCFLTVSLAQ